MDLSVLGDYGISCSYSRVIRFETVNITKQLCLLSFIIHSFQMLRVYYASCKANVLLRFILKSMILFYQMNRTYIERKFINNF